MEIPVEMEVTLTMSHLLQALTGSPALPRNIDNELIQFDHKSTKLMSLNTCAPSICFSNCIVNKEYSKFEESFLNIIAGAPGFGIE